MKKNENIETQYCEPGRWIYEGEKKRIELSELEDFISKLEWQETPVNGHIDAPAQQGQVIIKCIEAFEIPKVSHIAISNDLTHIDLKGLYGIRGHYNNGQTELYLFDDGIQATLIRADRHIPNLEKEAQIIQWLEFAAPVVNLQRNSSLNRAMYAKEQFGRDCVYECRTLAELATNLRNTTWQIGQTFFHKELCFINKNDFCVRWILMHGASVRMDIELPHLLKMFTAGNFITYLENLLALDTNAINIAAQ